MKNFTILLLFVAVPFLSARLFGWLSRRVPDGIIDGLIKANRARPRSGMSAIDWRKVDRSGEWGEDAQRRYEREQRVH